MAAAIGSTAADAPDRARRHRSTRAAADRPLAGPPRTPARDERSGGCGWTSLAGLARERSGGYEADADVRAGAPGVDSSDAPARAVAAVADAVEGLGAVDLAGLDRAALTGLAREVQGCLDRLTLRRDRIAGELRRRAVAAAGPGRESRAAQVAQRELAAELRLTPSEAKAASEAGRVAIDRPELAAAREDGRLRPEQAAVIGRALRDVPPAQVDAVREELVAAARDEDAVRLGRRARRRLAALDQEAALAAEARRHARRRASLRVGPDGALDLSASVGGLDAEVVCTAVDAFRTPDAPGEPQRSPEQRTADALVAALRASLDLGAAPRDRRVRPHVVVTVAAEDLRHGTGHVELPWVGPVPTGAVRRVTGDATVHLVGLDDLGLPIALSRATEHPTAAQYLALSLRDGGCRHPGCDAPAAWCDVAHATARRDGGEVSLDNTLLLCRRHHRRLDLGGWTIRIDGWEATFTHPDGRVLTARRPDRAPPPRDPPDTS